MTRFAVCINELKLYCF